MRYLTIIILIILTLIIEVSLSFATGHKIYLMDSMKSLLYQGAEVGEYSSLALDSNDIYYISFYVKPSGYIAYTRGTEGISGGRVFLYGAIDYEGNVGAYNSIALSSNNKMYISYYDIENKNLKAYLDNKTHIVDDEGDVGRFTSIALDSQNNPHISYRDATNTALKYAKWTGSVWDIHTVDNGGDVGEWSDVAVDSQDYPHISYYGNCNLKYARWTGNEWKIQNVHIDGDVGGYTSIALDDEDHPHISYYDATNGDLKYAHWTGSEWEIIPVDTGYATVTIPIPLSPVLIKGDVGKYTSIALDSQDYPYISYFDSTNCDLRCAIRTESGWDIFLVDSEGNVGSWSSIAIDSKDVPHITYYDQDYHIIRYVIF